MFGEQIQHVHFVLIPRGKEEPVEHRSAALILNQMHYMDPEAAPASACAPSRGAGGAGSSARVITYIGIIATSRQLSCYLRAENLVRVAGGAESV